MVRVGTSGWSYEDWVGPFYPVHLRSRPDAWLAFYATRFRTVEINSTFYAFPDEELVASWARAAVELADRDRAPFEFSLKLPRAVTHDALGAGDVDRARDETGRFDREVLDPLSGEGVLGAVLVQLPPDLEASADAVIALAEVVGALAERRVALEFRHPSWFHHGVVVREADRLFVSPWVCLVEQDNPTLPPALAPVGARHAYLRLHGRRGDAWARAGGAKDGARYDYLYARDELAPIAERAARLEAERKEVRVYLNNTPHAKATANAYDVLDMLGQAPRAPRPRLQEQQRLG